MSDKIFYLKDLKNKCYFNLSIENSFSESGGLKFIFKKNLTNKYKVETILSYHEYEESLYKDSKLIFNRTTKFTGSRSIGRIAWEDLTYGSSTNIPKIITKSIDKLSSDSCFSSKIVDEIDFD